jgi:hypothetical protein
MRSSDTIPVEVFFDGRPGALRLFQAIRSYIESIGPVEVKTTRTQVSFTAGTAFAWVWLPQLWVKRRPEDSITVSFSLDRRVEDERIAEAVEPRPGRWMHHLVIEGETDFDDDVRGWLREAYSLGEGVNEV